MLENPLLSPFFLTYVEGGGRTVCLLPLYWFLRFRHPAGASWAAARLQKV